MLAPLKCTSTMMMLMMIYLKWSKVRREVGVRKEGCSEVKTLGRPDD